MLLYITVRRKMFNTVYCLFLRTGKFVSLFVKDRLCVSSVRCKMSLSLGTSPTGLSRSGIYWNLFKNSSPTPSSRTLFLRFKVRSDRTGSCSGPSTPTGVYSRGLRLLYLGLVWSNRVSDVRVSVLILISV